MRVRLLSALLLTAACAVPQKVRMTTQFNPAEHERFLNQGTSSITGQAFLRQVNGGTVTCAGNQVMLLPNTNFFREVPDHIRNGESIEWEGVSISGGSARSTRCDAQGNFQFTSLPAESWYIVTQVTWGVPQRYGVSAEGGAMMAPVTLSEGKSVNVIMSSESILRTAR